MTDHFVTTRDGARLWTHTSGDPTAPPVVLLNGGPGMADYLGPLADLLAPWFRVQRLEPRGCGRSARRGPYRVQRLVADLEELRQHIDVPRWHVVGHSWGVDLGLAYALAYPKSVMALVGLAGGRVHSDASWHLAYQRARHTETLPRSASAPNRSVNRALNSDWRRYCQAPGLLQALARCNTPTLLLYAEHDIRPSWPTRQLAALMPAARLQLVPGADHNMWQGAGAAIAQQIAAFVAAQN